MTLTRDGIEWSDQSNFAKEMRKWDTPKSQGGYKCDGFEPYPKMLYRAQLHTLSNTMRVMTDRDILSPDNTVVILSKESFDASCQMIVHDEHEHEKAKANGWRDTPQAARDYQDGAETEKAVAAAVRAHEDRNMSDRAKAEIKVVEEHSGTEHVAEMPEKPRRRGGWPKGKPRKAAQQTSKGSV